jgi:ferredoxin
MRVTLDVAKCSGHARCNAAAPQVYEVDEEGYSTVRDLETPARLEQAARTGAASCPERALTIHE